MVKKTRKNDSKSGMVLMAVRFILGRSGTGKTSYCIKAIADALSEPADNRSLLLLVPEQATYQAERAILSDKKIAGYHRLQVLSFDRLQFLLLGKNTARPALSRIGRQMIVHRILRDNKSKLKLFGSSANQPGLGRQMAQTIAELHRYAKTPDDVNQLLSELQKDKRNNLAVLKFKDIGLIFTEYLKFIEGRFLDPDAQLTRACRAVAEADFIKDATLWVDGFAGFTTSELAILTELLKAAEDSQIALCLDPSDIDPANPDAGLWHGHPGRVCIRRRAEKPVPQTGLFYPTQCTYTNLVERITKSKLHLAEPIILEQAVRFSACPQLAHIERAVSETEPSKVTADDKVRIISAPNERAEVRFVARQILNLVREKDFRYRDIAVIASDIEQYQHYIRAYFEDYGIPFFIDKRKPLNQHPVVQLICSALQAITGGFSNSDIFAWLKTDLVPVERFDVDMLENYCLAFGITPGDWQSDKPWHLAGPDNKDFDENCINQIRLKAIGPLLELRDRLCPAGNPAKTTGPGDFTRAVFNFLDELGVRQTIGDWIKQADEKKDKATADEHQQFYNKLVDIFDELGEVFAGAAMTAEDYLAIISSAFSQLTLAFIPPTLDQVLVGSIERSRHPDLKAVFLIGTTQRRFPMPVVPDSILTDPDRKAAESADFLLAPTTQHKLAERRYLAYIAFTRPSEFLCVTYPAVDEKGGAVPRSQFAAELESLFEDLAEESIADEPCTALVQGEQTEIEKIHSEGELAETLCTQLGKDTSREEFGAGNDQLSGLLDAITSDEQLTELGSMVLSAINYDNRAQLDSDIVDGLFGRQIRSSATKLSTFAACPYQHFARYVLDLKEREEFKFEPLDLGNFYHKVLDALLKQLNSAGESFATAADKRLLELLKGQISKLVTEDAFISHFARHSPHNAFIIHSAGEVLEDCVLAVAQMVRAGSFRPALSEVAFGRVKDTPDTLGKYELALPDARVLSLSGKIDRLDIANIEDEKAAIVFDYKRRDKSFSWADFYHGLDMQLPIYMLAVRNAAGSAAKKTIGAFYMPVETKIAGAALDELPQVAEKFNHKAKGIFNGEFFQQLDSSNSNKFYNFFVTKKGDQYGHDNISGALRPDDFERVLKFTERKVVRLAQEILSGKIDVRPYRLSNKSPCTYCKYKPLCRFDWQINDYNLLESLSKLQALEKMGAADG